MSSANNVVRFSDWVSSNLARRLISRYQSTGYVCLDVVTHENWIHRWRWVEVIRKSCSGTTELWQFCFDQNNLEFRHYHMAVAAAGEVPAELLWKEMHVVAQFPAGFPHMSNNNLPSIDIPQDVLEESIQIFLRQSAETLTATGPAG